MDLKLRGRLVALAREKIPIDDVAHDFWHAMRVLSNAEDIAGSVRADLDVVVPSALFHDLVVYPKNHPKRRDSQIESALSAGEILMGISEFPQGKIDAVRTCILQCSFSFEGTPELLESRVLQDADRLEGTGAIALMRTYASTGLMQKPLYNPDDPFCETERDASPLDFALDLVFSRLLRMESRMHTEMGKMMAQMRSKFVHEFLRQLRREIKHTVAA